MLLTPVLIALLYASTSLAYYENSEHVKSLVAEDLYKLRNDETDEVWVVQFYNGTAENMRNVTNDFETAARSMSGYVKAAAMDIETNVLQAFVLRMTSFPTYVYYGYYKHMPETVDTLKTVDDIHDETSKQLTYFFEERSVHRYIKTKKNFELGITDVDYKLNKSLASWGVVFYDAKCPKCVEFAEIWKNIVAELREKIVFGAVNNPVYTVLTHENLEFPIIKYYPRGNKNSVKTDTYSGELQFEPIYHYFLSKIKIPKVQQIVQTSTAGPCLKRRYCIFAFLPELELCNSRCRADVIAKLREGAKIYKHRAWIWLWSEFEEQTHIEDAFSVQKSKHPTVVILNVHASSYKKIDLVTMLTHEDVQIVATTIIENKGFDHLVNTSGLPDINSVDPWVYSSPRDEL